MFKKIIQSIKCRLLRIKPWKRIKVAWSGVKPHGGYWDRSTSDLDWYQGLHDSRPEQHDAFLGWMHVANLVDTIESVCEIGCGYGVFYPQFFAEQDVTYLGIDISRQAIHHCNTKYSFGECDFVCADVLHGSFAWNYNLVFSHSVIDHVPDIDECLRAHVRASNKWIYVTSYRGFFPDLHKHKYTYDYDHECYYNDTSPQQAHRTLRDAGCKEISIFSSYAGEDKPPETVIIARV